MARWIDDFSRRLTGMAVALSLALYATFAQADTATGREALSEQRYGDAAQEFAAAFEGGDAEAAFYLGRMTELGLGTDPNLAGAAKFYLAGADAGSPGAQNRLGLMYLKGEATILQDYVKARELLCTAAEGGDVNAAFNCATVLERGLGGAADPAAAYGFYERAAEQGHIGAMNVFGLALITGKTVPRNFDRAIDMISRTAAQGNPIGLHALGQAYTTGVGVPRNLEKAHGYHNLAAARGHPSAATARARVEAEMSTAEIERAQEFARNWQAKPDPGPKATVDPSDGALNTLKSE